MSKYVYVVEVTDLDASIRFLDVYSNKKVALENFNESSKGRIWIEQMNVPLDIFLEHYKRFEDEENGNEWGYLWKDYMGYTEEDWSDSYEIFESNRYDLEAYKVNFWKQTLQQNEKDEFIRELLYSVEIPKLVIKY